MSSKYNSIEWGTFSHRGQVQVLSDDIEPIWLDIEFRDLKKTDRFRIMKDIYPTVLNDKGETIGKCITDAFLSENGIWLVDIE